MLTRSDAEIASDEVMGWIVWLECVPNAAIFNEVTSMLNHLYDLHKLRDSALYYELDDMLEVDGSEIDLEALCNMQTNWGTE